MNQLVRWLLFIPLACAAGCGNPNAGQVDPNAVATVFIGDSITQRWDLVNYFPRAPYTNAGIGGQTTADMLARFDTDVVAAHPKMVVILGGTNNILKHQNMDTAVANMKSMVAKARAAGIVPLVGTVPPIATNLDAFGNTDFNPVVVSYNARLKQLGVAVADYHAVLADASNLPADGMLWDGIHPSSAGYRKMRTVLRAVIP